MPDPPTFREWLASRPPTVPLLQGFMVAQGPEWLRTEFKAATEDIDHGLVRETAALNNTRGGELFLGIDPARKIAGTAVTPERLRQVLAQEGVAPPNDACFTDLNLAVGQPLIVEDGTLRVLVLEIHRTGKVALARSSGRQLVMYYRRGDETLQADAAKTIDWYRLTRREELLIGIYRELKALSRRIRRWSVVPPLPEPELPFLASCLANGSLYALLSEDDLIAVIGGSKDLVQGSGGGFVQSYLQVVQEYKDLFRRSGTFYRSMSIDQLSRSSGKSLSVGDYQTSLDQQVRDFRNWLLKQGILPD